MQLSKGFDSLGPGGLALSLFAERKNKYPSKMVCDSEASASLSVPCERSLTVQRTWWRMGSGRT